MAANTMGINLLTQYQANHARIVALNTEKTVENNQSKRQSIQASIDQLIVEQELLTEQIVAVGATQTRTWSQMALNAAMAAFTSITSLVLSGMILFNSSLTNSEKYVWGLVAAVVALIVAVAAFRAIGTGDWTAGLRAAAAGAAAGSAVLGLGAMRGMNADMKEVDQADYAAYTASGYTGGGSGNTYNTTYNQEGTPIKQNPWGSTTVSGANV